MENEIVTRQELQFILLSVMKILRYWRTVAATRRPLSTYKDRRASAWSRHLSTRIVTRIWKESRVSTSSAAKHRQLIFTALKRKPLYHSDLKRLWLTLAVNHILRCRVSNNSININRNSKHKKTRSSIMKTSFVACSTHVTSMVKTTDTRFTVTPSPLTSRTSAICPTISTPWICPVRNASYNVNNFV